MDQDATWYGGRLRPRRHCASWGPGSPSPKEHNPQYTANVRCGQTAGWSGTKMPLSIAVGLALGDFVFDGDLAPSAKIAQPPPIFWPMSIVAKRLDG